MKNRTGFLQKWKIIFCIKKRKSWRFKTVPFPTYEWIGEEKANILLWKFKDVPAFNCSLAQPCQLTRSRIRPKWKSKRGSKISFLNSSTRLLKFVDSFNLKRDTEIWRLLLEGMQGGITLFLWNKIQHF